MKTLKQLVGIHGDLATAGRLYNARSFFHIDQRHLEAALILREPARTSGRFWLPAVYLAGYCVECDLEALILINTTPRKMSARLDEVAAGKQGHNLEKLRSLFRSCLRSDALPEPVKEPLNFVCPRWSTALRYADGQIRAAEAETFLQHVGTIHDWCDEVLR